MRQATERARALRRTSTTAEAALWAVLRGRRFEGLKWRRQMPVDRYFADFGCKDAKLVIELDGGQHGRQVAYDAERTRVLETCGFRVLRFWNDDVLTNLDGVAAVIQAEIAFARASSPSPSHSAAAERAPPSPVPGRGVGGADHV